MAKWGCGEFCRESICGFMELAAFGVVWRVPIQVFEQDITNPCRVLKHPRCGVSP